MNLDGWTRRLPAPHLLQTLERPLVAYLPSMTAKSAPPPPRIASALSLLHSLPPSCAAAWSPPPFAAGAPCTDRMAPVPTSTSTTPSRTPPCVAGTPCTSCPAPPPAPSRTPARCPRRCRRRRCRCRHPNPAGRTQQQVSVLGIQHFPFAPRAGVRALQTGAQRRHALPVVLGPLRIRTGSKPSVQPAPTATRSAKAWELCALVQSAPATQL